MIQRRSNQVIMLCLLVMIILSSVHCLRSSSSCSASLLDSKSQLLHHSHGTGYPFHHHHHHHHRSCNNKLQSSSRLYDIRGGFVADTLSSFNLNVLSKASNYILLNPTNLFNALLASLACLTLLLKYVDSKSTTSQSMDTQLIKPAGVKSLQFRFLMVFWLMRMADWLQGPYFYEVYSTKVFNGVPATLDLVSKLFLVGFASTGIFGPWIGRFVDTIGRKAGTLAFAMLYAIGALSTRSNVLGVLLLGRLAGGLGTSLLFSAPEAWLVGEHQKNKFDGRWLGETFGLAYAGDSLVAITAGQLASLTANAAGPSGPFTLSVVFLFLGGLLALLKWDENVAVVATTTTTTTTSANSNASSSAVTTHDSSGPSKDNTSPVTPTATAAVVSKGEEVVNKKPSILDAINLISKDRRIMLLGAVQALFEGSMYIFVLQWPPAMKAAIQASLYGPQAEIPFGNIFSCFMASCLLGSTVFGALQRKQALAIEKSTSIMLLLATTAITMATLFGSQSLGLLILSLFVFEFCVGMYFPSIGTLRSKYLPDSHRSVIMNLFGIPLNLIVVSVFLSIKSLGVQGALQCGSISLTLATLCMSILTIYRKEDNNSSSSSSASSASNAQLE